jgi:putative transposase
MARKARKDQVIPGLPHHVVIRGNNRRRLFSYPSDYRRYLRFLVQALPNYPVAIHQLTLQGNHVHMINTPDEVEALSRFIGKVNHRYARVRNDARDASGKLFEERFWCKPITSDRQLHITTAYNDTNYFLTTRRGDPFSHRWSTIQIHAGAASVESDLREIWTPSPWYLGLGSDAEERAARYRAVIRDYLTTKELPQGVMADLVGLESGPYTRRLERPNRTRASEPRHDYRMLRG